MTMTKALARAIGLDAGNRSMKRGGRLKWNEEDSNAATDAYMRALALVPVRAPDAPPSYAAGGNSN